MASICGRRIFQIYKRPLHMSAARLEKKVVHPLDLATGTEKMQMLAELAGNDDPFEYKVSKLGPGTKDCPNLVTSYFKSRLVGCICDEDQLHVNWMWLHDGAPRRCECGHWFKLVERQPLQVTEPEH